MEILRSSVLTQTQIFSTVPTLNYPPSLTTLNKKSRYKFRETQLKSFPNPPFSTNLPLINRKTPRITARFGRPTKRRNSLRKKLTGGDSQVSQKPQKNLDPLHHFVDNEVSESNLVTTILEGVNGKVGTNEIDSETCNLENSKRFEESLLWNKLEGWVEQYKKDIEFWGVGSNPIFTVYKHCNGTVERVLVDEDEILRRSGVDPLYFREERELEDFYDVNSKISHAKFLAREIEGGKPVMPNNSSVAKFVVSGENTGLVSRIRSISIPHNLLPKVSRVGIAMVCGLLFVWVTKKLFSFGGREETEVTRFEKEMLRRKIKSRMEKEKLQKGSVEIIEDPSEPSSMFTERPHLDKDELLSSIRKANGLNDDMILLDVGGVRDTALGMDVKIREIQMMARHARNIERGKCSEIEGDESNEQTSNELPVLERDTAEEHAESTGNDELEKQASNVLPSMEKGAAEESAGGLVKPVNGLPSECFTKTRVVNGISTSEILESRETELDDAKFTSKKVSQGNENVEPHSVSTGGTITDVWKSHESYNSSDSSISTEGVKSSDAASSPLKPQKHAPGRRMPKIIRSVKEAREYLSRKDDRKPQVGVIPAAAAPTNEGMNNYFGQMLGEGDDALGSSNVDRIMDSVPADDICVNFALKDNEYLATDTNGLNKENQVGQMQDRPYDPEHTEGSIVDTKANLGETRKIDEMKHSSSHESSDVIPGDNTFCDSCLGVNEHLLIGQSLDKVSKLDEMPKATNQSETSDFIPGRNASHDAGDSSENALRDANLVDKDNLSKEIGLDKVDGINEMPKPTKRNEVLFPVAAGHDLHDSGFEENSFLPIEINDKEDFGNNQVESKSLTAETSQGSEYGVNREGGAFADKDNWLEKNFHEVEPIVKKIGTGFRNNYIVAREKVKQEVDIGLDLVKLKSIKDDTELEWMQDDELRDIVFRVRENELAGRDPFHSMDPENKVAFFKGLESKVEKENQKLSTLHEWLHSSIENVDYGGDGISLYDPPEKVIPRWKGPPIDKIYEFLNNTGEKLQPTSFLQKANETTEHVDIEMSKDASTTESRPREKVAKIPKTVIEASDGSIKPGKKSGKEYWHHTKKWSRGFVESYNAESDPEVKSVMKNIGKDLDRWITEKEIQEAADLMDKIPQRGKEIIEKKLNKLKREMEMFGPQAVVSKYREYSEEKEEDHLWWLDLRHVLCIELYTYEGEDLKVGFYSLEMATDLELEPKPHHVIAFEDPGDCKNLCYIMQAHLEMLGKGKAFVVPQPPKDVFRQAKANGFGVTVVRKGELQFNVDQPLEEVEELITEIGSKMYHDKITRERSVDISSLMKGVFGVNKPSPRKRKKRAWKRPSKH